MISPFLCFYGNGGLREKFGWGSELIGMTAIEFVRILSNSKEWLRTISLIAIAEASTRTLTPELETFGVFLANKRTWKSDVPRFLSTLDHAFDCDVGERDRGAGRLARSSG